ncbi:MAG TPA: DNA repair protein RadC [Bacteroidales bacterium]|nr:DNA repair protein RadC [Bacteroidales bacterium]
MKPNNSIKNWAEDDRPREKMMRKGIGTLSNAELLAILFSTGSREMSAVELARQLLEMADNNLDRLAKMGLDQLMQIKGIGEAKAISVHTALELGKRRSVQPYEEAKTFASSHDVYTYFGNKLRDLPYEEFWILLLNRANRMIEPVKISQGGMSGTVVDVRIVLRNAIIKQASSVIMCHNHPSGNTKPSQQDIDITKKVKEAGALMDIKLFDHLIVTDKAYFSFADEGMI